jgi:hypothetical protein
MPCVLLSQPAIPLIALVIASGFTICIGNPSTLKAESKGKPLAGNYMEWNIKEASSFLFRSPSSFYCIPSLFERLNTA